MIKTGFGREKITPPLGTTLVGYFEPRISDSVHDDLYSIAVCFEDYSGKIFFFVAVDLCFVTVSLCEKVESLLKKETGLDRQNFIIHATHTHTGPLSEVMSTSIFTNNLYIPDEYTKILPFLIFKSMKCSYQTREDSLIGFAKTTVDGISFIRRYRMKDGTVVTNPVNPDEIISPDGYPNREFMFTKICRPDSELKIVILHFPLHPDTMGGTAISGDWPNFLRLKIEEHYKGKVNAVFFNGCCGDINHIDPFNLKTRNRGIGERIASILFEKYLRMENSVKCTEYKNFSFIREKTFLPAVKITSEALVNAENIVKITPENTLKYLVARSLLINRRKTTRISYEFQVFSIGKDFTSFFLPGEIFSGICSKIKRNSNVKFVWTVENCNAYIGYIPDDKAFAAAKKNALIREEFPAVRVSEAIGINVSYETSPLCCRVGPGSEKRLVSETKKSLEKIKRTF